LVLFVMLRISVSQLIYYIVVTRENISDEFFDSYNIGVTNLIYVVMFVFMYYIS
jgi:hypothetical protein